MCICFDHPGLYSNSTKLAIYKYILGLGKRADSVINNLRTSTFNSTFKQYKRNTSPYYMFLLGHTSIVSALQCNLW